jgi:hypothetical protein
VFEFPLSKSKRGPAYDSSVRVMDPEEKNIAERTEVQWSHLEDYKFCSFRKFPTKLSEIVRLGLSPLAKDQWVPCDYSFKKKLTLESCGSEWWRSIHDAYVFYCQKYNVTDLSFVSDVDRPVKRLKAADRVDDGDNDGVDDGDGDGDGDDVTITDGTTTTTPTINSGQSLNVAHNIVDLRSIGTDDDDGGKHDENNGRESRYSLSSESSVTAIQTLSEDITEMLSNSSKISKTNELHNVLEDMGLISDAGDVDSTYIQHIETDDEIERIVSCFKTLPARRLEALLNKMIEVKNDGMMLNV